MNKERPGELNQKIKRLKKSRDGLKLDCREKSKQNKKLNDRNKEIIESRDRWKTHAKELTEGFNRGKKELEQQVQTKAQELERERMRANQERERADKLQAEIDVVWKKKSRA